MAAIVQLFRLKNVWNAELNPASDPVILTTEL